MRCSIPVLLLVSVLLVAGCAEKPAVPENVAAAYDRYMETPNENTYLGFIQVRFENDDTLVGSQFLTSSRVNISPNFNKLERGGVDRTKIFHNFVIGPG